MSRQATLSLVVFLALLALVLGTREDRVSVGIRSLELPVLERDAILSLRIGGTHRAQLWLDGQSWRVRDPNGAPPGFPVEPSAIEAVLEAIAALDAGRFVTGRAASHAELRIDEASGTTLAVSDRSGASISLVFGRPAKGGGTLLRQREGDDVFVTASRLPQLLRKNTEQWRRRNLVGLEADGIERLTVALESSVPYTLLRGPGSEGTAGDWQLEQGTALPDDFVLDSQALGQLVAAFARLRASGFVDEDPGDEETGLGDAASRIRAIGSSGESVEVRIGRVATGSSRYARMEGDPQIYRVAEWAVKQLHKPLLDLRDLSLLSADVSTIVSASFTHPGGSVSLSKRSGSWVLEEPAVPPADYTFDPMLVPTRLASLSRMRGSRFLGRSSELTAGFSDPVTIEIGFQDGSSRAVRFGDEVAEADDVAAGQVYVRSGNDFVYAVPKAMRDRYTKPLELFRRVSAPPPMPGGLSGLEGLPPDMRRKIQEALRQQGRGP